MPEEPTPKTSNKRVVSIENPVSTATTSSSQLPSIQESSLPLRNPLHNKDSEESLFESHFQAVEGGESDTRPVAPTRKPSEGSFQASPTSKGGGSTVKKSIIRDGGSKIRTLEREMDFQGDEEDGEEGCDVESATSSYVGDVDERNEEDIQFQPEGFLSVEPALSPKPGSFNASSVHTEATSTMSASGVTNTSMPSPGRSSPEKEINFSPGGSDIEGPNVPKKGSFVGNVQDSTDLSDTKPTTENPLSGSNIPGESFLKMGAMMHSQLADGGEEGTGLEGTKGASDEDDFLGELLDDNLILVGETEIVEPKSVQNSKDEHDDLLDSVLGEDDDVDDTTKEDPGISNADDELLDSMLGDDDAHEEEKTKALNKKSDDYVPDESIRKLEALLDEGLAGHASNVEGDVSHTPEVDHHDSMARELDALLEGGLEEEVQFDDEPVESTKAAKTPSKKSRNDNKAQRTKKATQAKTTDADSKKNTPGKVGRFFRSRSSPDKKDDKKAGQDTNKKKPMSIRKRMSSGARKVPSQIAKSPANPAAVSPMTDRKPSPTRFSSFKRFMSPTCASRRHFMAEDEIANETPKRFGTPSYSTPKPSSWRSTGRSFMSSTLSSLKKMRSTSPSPEKEHRKDRNRSGDVVREDGTKVRLGEAFMEPTFSKTMLETETRILEERKALEREEEAKKIVVKLSWEEEQKPSPLLDYSSDLGKRSEYKLQTPSQASHRSSTPTWSPKGRFVWTPKGLVPGDMSSAADDEVTPLKHTPRSVFSPRSLGSLSSMCSIRSFVSPKKAGVRGCLSKYNPTLFDFQGPCDFCVFRLSDEEKDELDAHGRHFKVQFTKGGCPDCQNFPPAEDEPPVRLCMNCFAMSHPPQKKRFRKKGNDQAIGYSFAKAEYV